MFEGNRIPLGTLSILLFSVTATAAAQTQHRPPKPDLHAGGFHPSTIMNRAVTDVTLPGFNLSGAKVESEPMCPVVSYQVISDNEIRMKLRGEREVDEPSGQCTITIHTPGGTVSNWLYVKLTADEEKEHQAHQNAKDWGKVQQLLARTGKSWRITYSDGSTETYISMHTDPNAGIPSFRSASGKTVQIAVGEDNGVTLIDTEHECMRGGKLVGTDLKDGESMGNCSPPGKWSATVTR